MFKSRFILFLFILLIYSLLSAQVIPPSNLTSELNSATGEVQLEWQQWSGPGYYEDFSDGVADDWYPLTGNWFVVSEHYQVDAQQQYNTSYYDEEFTNYTIEARMKFTNATGSNNIGFMFNGDPANHINGKWLNTYQIYYQYDGRWYLNKYVDGSYVGLQSGITSPNLNVDDWNVLTVICAFGNIDVYINEVLQGTYYDTDFLLGKAGFKTYGAATDGTFDYISVMPLEYEYTFGEINQPEYYNVYAEGDNEQGEIIGRAPAPQPPHQQFTYRPGMSNREFLYYKIYRDGIELDTTSLLTYTDQLPEFGLYEYEVTAVYDEGESTPAGPEIVEWIADYIWLADILVEDAGGAEISQMITFGRHPYATDGIDTAFGEIDLPPPPPAGAFDARFVFPDMITSSHRDIRSTENDEVEWKIVFQAGPQGYPVTLSWEPLFLPEGSFMMEDALGIGLISVNMKEQNNVVITNESLTSVVIRHDQQIVSTFTTMTGWNMISVPLEAPDMSVSAVFPGAASSAFKFDDGYLPVDMLEMSVGYWLKFDEPLIHNLNGMPVADPIPVSEGWNIVGPFHFDIGVIDIVTNPAGILASQFFEFNDGYYTADILEPGKGYWVKSTGDGEILYPLPTKKGPAEYYEELAAFYAVDVEVNDGYAGYNINGGIDPAATDGIDADLGEAELPPAPPAGIFDARMILPDGTTSSLQDYRNGDAAFNGVHEHILKWQLGAGDTLWLHVTIPEVSGTVHLHAEDPFGGAFVNANQYDGASRWYYVDNSALTQLNITLSYTAPIPVELTSFAASVVGNKVELSWETATETNNEGFDILRSNDNNRFKKIGFVSGNGTSSEPVKYSFSDEKPLSGTNYYRLKQIDFDGAESYSEIIEVNFVPSEFSLEQNYPNPFNPVTKIKFALPAESKVSLNIYNVVGQKVGSIARGNFKPGVHEVEFNASSLSSGVYFYTINAEGIDGEKFTGTKKLMVLK